MRFTVIRTELWIQHVVVEADTVEEARKKASHDDGEITDDPQFREFLYPGNWEVKEE